MYMGVWARFTFALSHEAVEVYRAEYAKLDCPATLIDMDLVKQATEIGHLCRATMLEIQLCRSLLKESDDAKKAGCRRYLLSYGSVRRCRLNVQICLHASTLAE